MIGRTPLSSPATGRPLALAALFALQAFCVLSLIGDSAFDLFVGDGAEPVETEDRLEAVVVAALTFSLIFTGHEMWRLLSRQQRLEEQLKAASGAFQEVLQSHFDRWALTQAERDVALLAIKGLSLSEIAEMRSSREGTVKAQCSAIYRKAGVSGRPQLLSLFIEDLMAEPLHAAAAVAGA